MADKLTEEEQATWDALNAPYPPVFAWDGFGIQWGTGQQPQSPSKGQAWFDTDNNEAFIYDGTQWLKLIGP